MPATSALTAKLREPDGPAGDVFALGVMLYWMLSGEQLGEFPLRPTRYAEWVDVRVKTMDLSQIRDPDLIYPGQVFTIPE